MSLFRIPKAVCIGLKKVQSDFLWGGARSERRNHTVNWDVVDLSSDKGGLVVRRLQVMNMTLLVNGVGDLPLKEMLDGGTSSTLSMIGV